MDIVLIRHGQTEANLNKYFGTKETPLTKLGLDQAKKSRGARDLKIKKVLVSPYKRALDTMECLGLKGEVEEDLREINLGILEGKTYEEFQASNPKEAKLWTDDPINYRIPGGENMVDFYERVNRLIDRLIEEDEDCILVCHEGVIRIALAGIFGSPDLFFKFKSNNLGFTKITVEDKYKYINYVNRIHY